METRKNAHEVEVFVKQTRQMIEARQLYLAEHAKFLTAYIEGTNTNQQAIQDYLSDIFNISKSAIIIKNNDIDGSFVTTLKSLKEGLRERAKQLMVLKNCISNEELEEDTDRALCTLSFFLEKFYNESKLYKPYNNMSDVSWQEKVKISFHQTELFNRIRKNLPPILPSSVSDFSKVFRSIEKVRKVRHNGQDQYSLSQDIVYGWKEYHDEIMQKLNKAKSIYSDMDKDADYLKITKLMKEIEAFIETPSSIRDKSKAKIRENVAYKTTDGVAPVNQLDFQKTCEVDQFSKILQPKIKIFFTVDKPVKAYLKKLHVICEEIKEVNEINSYSQQQFKNIKIQLDLLREAYQRCKTREALFSQKMKIDETFHDAIILQQGRLDDLLNSCAVVCTMNFSSVAAVNQQINVFNDAIEEISKNIKSFNQTLNALNNDQKHQVEVRQRQIEHELLAKQQEQRTYQQNKAKELKEYKLEVEHQRAEKAKLKNLKLTNSKADEENTVTIEKFVNTSMEAKISALSESKLILLEQILDEKLRPHNSKDITFEKVCLLIEKDLEGTVSEVGNGSSHKRIEIEKLYVEIISHGVCNDAEIEVKDNKKRSNGKAIRGKQEQKEKKEMELEIKRSSVATGGMFKPHGKQHSSGALSSFNLKLIADCFKHAGIHVDVVRKYLAIKEQEKIAIAQASNCQVVTRLSGI